MFGANSFGSSAFGQPYPSEAQQLPSSPGRVLNQSLPGRIEQPQPGQVAQ